MRIRSKASDPLEKHTFTEETFLWQQGSTTTSVQDGLIVGELTVFQDVVTKDYRKKQAAGTVINNPCISDFESFSYVPSPCTREYVGSYPQHLWSPGSVYKIIHSGIPVGDRDFTQIPEVDVESLVIEASTRALAEVGKPDAQGLVILAELQKTLQFMRNPVEALTVMREKILRIRDVNERRKFILELLQSRVRNAKNVMDIKRWKAAIDGYLSRSLFAEVSRATAVGVSSQHLAVLYGLLPLIHDIEDVLKAARKLQSPKRVRATARGKASASTEANWTRTLGISFGWANISGYGSRQVNVRAGSLYDIGLVGPTGLQELGLMLSDLPAAVYEVISYSFVVDWVINLGDYIQAITPVAGVNRLAEWYTVETIETSIETIDSVENGGGDWSVQGGGDMGTCVRRRRTRTPTNLGDRSGLTFTCNMGVSQILASISLLTQRLLTKRRR